MARSAARRAGRRRPATGRAGESNGAAGGADGGSVGGTAALIAGPVAVLAAVSLGAPDFGMGDGGSPGIEAAALTGLILAVLAGAALPHLDRSGSLMGRFLGRRARYFGELAERFGYTEGPTHSLIFPLACAAALVPAGFYFFGPYGAALMLALCAGYLGHVVADLVIYARPVALLWPVRRERTSPGQWTGDPEEAEEVARRAARAETVDLAGGSLLALLRKAATPVLLLALAYLAYSTVWASISATEPGFVGRMLGGAVSYASNPSSISLRMVAGLVVVAVLILALVRLLPALGERAADKAAAGGEYGGLATHLIRPTSRDNEIEPERFRRLVGRLPAPPSGFYPEVVIGDRVGAAVSGREVEEIKDRLQDEYMMDATIVPLDATGSLAASPTAPADGASAESASAEADSNAADDSSTEGGKEQGEARAQHPGERDGMEKVACRFDLGGEAIRGILGSTELGKHDPLTGALNGIRRALDVTRGERALLQMCVRPVNEGSRSPLQSRIDEIKEKEAEQGKTKIKKKSGLLWWVLLLSKHGKMRDYYNRQSLKKEIADQGDKVSAEERDERKQLAERAQQPTFLVELRMLAYVDRQRDPRGFLAAAEGYANAFDRPGGAAWTMAEESTGESALARRVSLRLPGPPPGRDEAKDLLTADEITAMWHPLGKSVDVQGREVSSLVTRAPYVGIPTDGLLIGLSDDPAYQGFELFIEEDELDTSGRLVGTTGNGKSTLILSMLLPALRSGVGMSLFDPKGGDLFTELVSALPTSVLEKALLVDPGDETFPCPVLNFLDPFSYMQPDDQAETIVRALEYRFPDGFGHNMRPIFVRAALACIAANAKLKAAGLAPKFGLLDLTETGFLEPRIEVGEPKDGEYEQPPVRAEVLSHLRGDPNWEEIVRYWDTKDANQSSGQQSKEWNPITNKIGQLKNRNVAKFLAGGHSSFDLMDVMQNGKLLLFNLSQGSMAGDAHELLGTLVLNLIMRTAAIRHDRAVRGVDGADPSTLTRFINVVDEVQNFLCPEMTKVLTEGRAMRCSLWAAHQYMHQIKEKDKSMAEAFANAGTSVLFGTTIDDAKNVAEFIDDPRFTATVVAGMHKYHFVLQRKDGEPVTGETIPMAGKDQKRVRKVRRYSAAQVAAGAHRTSAGGASAGGDDSGQADCDSQSANGSRMEMDTGSQPDSIRGIEADNGDGAGSNEGDRNGSTKGGSEAQGSRPGSSHGNGSHSGGRYPSKSEHLDNREQVKRLIKKKNNQVDGSGNDLREDGTSSVASNAGASEGDQSNGGHGDMYEGSGSAQEDDSERGAERAARREHSELDDELPDE